MLMRENDRKEPVLKKNLWKHEEDQILVSLVNAQIERFISWQQIATDLNDQLIKYGAKSNRDAKRCRERWSQHLNPCLSCEKWTNEEAAKLFELNYLYPQRWSKLSLLLAQSGFKKRSHIQIKNFYNLKLLALTKKINDKIKQNNKELQRIKRRQFKQQQKYIYVKELSIQRLLKKQMNQKQPKSDVVEDSQKPSQPIKYSTQKISKFVVLKHIQRLFLYTDDQFSIENSQSHQKIIELKRLKFYFMKVIVQNAQIQSQCINYLNMFIAKISRPKIKKNHGKLAKNKLIKKVRPIHYSSYKAYAKYKETKKMKQMAILHPDQFAKKERNLRNSVNNIPVQKDPNPIVAKLNFLQDFQQQPIKKHQIRLNQSTAYSTMSKSQQIIQFQSLSNIGTNQLHELNSFLSKSQKIFNQNKSLQQKIQRQNFAFNSEKAFQNPFERQQQINPSNGYLNIQGKDFTNLFKKIPTKEIFFQNVFSNPLGSNTNKNVYDNFSFQHSPSNSFQPDQHLTLKNTQIQNVRTYPFPFQYKQSQINKLLFEEEQKEKFLFEDQQKEKPWSLESSKYYLDSSKCIRHFPNTQNGFNR